MTIFAVWLGSQIADGIVDGISSLHAGYQTLETSITEMAQSNRKTNVEFQKQAYRETVARIQQKYPHLKQE